MRRRPRAASPAWAATPASRHGGARQAPALYSALDPIESFDERARIALLERADAEARRLSPHVRQVIVSLAGEYNRMLVASSDGTFAGDVRPLVRMNVSVIVERDGRRESASAGGGGRFDYGYFTDEDRACAYAREAVRQALVNLEAEPAPAGTMTVVLGPAGPGCCCTRRSATGSKATSTARAARCSPGRIGERVASEQCTVVDDGTLAAAARVAHRRRRGDADPVHDPHRERHPEGLHAGQAERAPHGDEVDRQRAARVLRPPPDAPHDQHLHAARALRARRDHRIGGQGALRGELRRRAGRHHVGEVRVLRERGLPRRRAARSRGRSRAPPSSATAPTCSPG